MRRQARRDGCLISSRGELQDLAYWDEDGDFFLVDRKKDIIRREGENTSPVEVRKINSGNPKVAESALVEYCQIEKMTNLDKLPPYGF